MAPYAFAGTSARAIVISIWILFYCQYQPKALQDPSVHMVAEFDRLLCHRPFSLRM